MRDTTRQKAINYDKRHTERHSHRLRLFTMRNTARETQRQITIIHGERHIERETAAENYDSWRKEVQSWWVYELNDSKKEANFESFVSKTALESRLCVCYCQLLGKESVLLSFQHVCLRVWISLGMSTTKRLVHDLRLSVRNIGVVM